MEAPRTLAVARENIQLGRGGECPWRLDVRKNGRCAGKPRGEASQAFLIKMNRFAPWTGTHVGYTSFYRSLHPQPSSPRYCPQTAVAFRRLACNPFLAVPTPVPQKNLLEAGSTDTENADSGAGAGTESWADVNALFENDDGFVRSESERYIEEAAEAITSRRGWNADRVSRQWVASYRLSVFETRRQAQRFFSWGIPDDG